jgi:hypothetical protein
MSPLGEMERASLYAGGWWSAGSAMASRAGAGASGTEGSGGWDATKLGLRRKALMLEQDVDGEEVAICGRMGIT